MINSMRFSFSGARIGAFLAATVFASLTPSLARAALEQRTVQGLSPSSSVTAVYDSATRLEWLSPDATYGLGVGAVLASDFATRGYRYASGAELIQLVVDAGFDPSIGRIPGNMPDWENISGKNLDVIKNVVNLLAPIHPKWSMPTPYPIVYARLADIDPYVNSQYSDFAHKAAMIYAEESTGRFFVGGAGLGTTAGNYLVREVSSVPEPGAVAMFAAGLMVIARRKRQ